MDSIRGRDLMKHRRGCNLLRSCIDFDERHVQTITSIESLEMISKDLLFSVVAENLQRNLLYLNVNLYL